MYRGVYNGTLNSQRKGCSLIRVCISTSRGSYGVLFLAGGTVTSCKDVLTPATSHDYTMDYKDIAGVGLRQVHKA